MTESRIESLLDRARNVTGDPLSASARQRVLALLADPCEATWQEAFSVVVCPHGAMTLWSAMAVIRPGFQVQKRPGALWDRVPTREDVLSALRYATS